MKLLARITIALSALFLLLQACQEEGIDIPFLQVSAEVTQASAYGASDGAISVAVEGGQPPYQYFWSNGSKEQNLSGLPAGTYTLQVIDSESAVASLTVIVGQPEATPLGLSFTVKDASWYGGEDGEISLSISGGTAPYAALWNNEEEGTQLKGLVAGWYSVTVTDAGEPAIVTVDSVEVAQPEFVCGRDSITDVNGNKYPTVQIGGQCWLAENLRTANLPNEPAKAIEGRFCMGLNCTKNLGAHYSWEAMMNSAESASGEEEVQGICPCEWHVPTKEEWEALNAYLSVDGNGGSGTNVPNKLRGPDSPSGFDALNAGNWGYPVFEGDIAVFWTATEQAEGRAFYRLINNFPLLGQGHVVKNSGLSVRCIRNK